MLKGRAFGQRTCFDQGAPNLRVSRRNAVFSRFNKPPLVAEDGYWGYASFIDYLLLARIDGTWKIVCKLFAHTGGPAVVPESPQGPSSR